MGVPLLSPISPGIAQDMGYFSAPKKGMKSNYGRLTSIIIGLTGVRFYW
jgi:hypothetical protein